MATRTSNRTSEQQSRKAVKWQDFIHSDPEILVGKPVVRGTRLSVDFILRLLGNGWSVQEVLENYPKLTAEAVQAVFAYASECLSEEALFDMPRAAAGETSEHEASRQ